jgi:hypothetical protein
VAFLLLETYLIHCFGDFSKLLHCIKFGHFHVFLSFTCQGVLNSNKGEKVTWQHAWGVQALMHLQNMMSG